MTTIKTRQNRSLQIASSACILVGIIALFPPRNQIRDSGRLEAAGRGFLFNPEFSSVSIPTSNGGRVETFEINTGRLLAEALLILALAGFGLVYTWSEDA